ncbi:hypothetical protein CHUAL_009579 [Chamberlinius hualienensis]
MEGKIKLLQTENVDRDDRLSVMLASINHLDDLQRMGNLILHSKNLSGDIDMVKETVNAIICSNLQGQDGGIEIVIRLGSGKLMDTFVVRFWSTAAKNKVWRGRLVLRQVGYIFNLDLCLNSKRERGRLVGAATIGNMKNFLIRGNVLYHEGRKYKLNSEGELVEIGKTNEPMRGLESSIGASVGIGGMGDKGLSTYNDGDGFSPLVKIQRTPPGIVK